ncbi:MAG: PAS domain S-box protein [Methanosarcinales archaeon]|nr:PAS domain S-box protein [Methanosarcinales archaeon]
MSIWNKLIMILIVALLIVLSFSGSLVYAQEEQTKHVLVLNSYHRGFLWTDNIVKGIESVFGSEENNIELTIEYMDTKSIKYDARYKEKLYDLYKYKYGNQTFDLIISTDDNAFNFLCEYHEDIFPDTPVVFCGVNNLETPNLVDRDIFTGVIELLSEKETIDIALSLHPETGDIVFVIDSTPTGTQVWSQIQGLSGYYENIRMTCISGSLSMEHVEDNVSRLSDDTIVFFGPFNRDKSGKYYSSEEAASRVCRASVRPVYGYSVQVLPYGIVGGKLIGGVHHGQVAATMAKRILVGEAVRDIPVITEPQTQPMFDYNQIQRWGIKESDLPEDSIIVNKPYSFYNENKGLICGIIAFIAIQTLIIVALVVNRSRRKAAEDKLKESEDRFRTIFDSINDAVFIHDIETGAILNVNKTTCDMYGYTREELCKLDVQTISIGEAPYTLEDAIEWMKKTTAGEPQVFEWMGKHKSGRLFWVEVSMRSAVVGGCERLLVVVRDITQRKAAEEELLKRATALERSNKELEQFAYVASHDLQEPLRMVSSYVQLLARRYKGKLDHDADDFIGYAVDGANRMQTLIDDLLIFSRVGTQGKSFEPTNCETVLEQVLINLKMAIGDSYAMITHDPLPTIMADGSQLTQLLQNLISNAIKFQGDETPRIHISAEQKDDEWEFSVADNGIGIKPEFFDRIFVIFQRLHSREEYSGTGIGLAVCKKIVERHGGRIWVESVPGKGTTFFFTIPNIGPELGDREPGIDDR